MVGVLELSCDTSAEFSKPSSKKKNKNNNKWMGYVSRRVLKFHEFFMKYFILMKNKNKMLIILKSL